MEEFGSLVPQGTLVGEKVLLRPIALEDCTNRYVSWLNDPEVNRYLETRWQVQTLETIREFVRAVMVSADSLLLAIRVLASGEHVGNIKLGPLNRRHSYADVSYFIGERTQWGRGLATESIRLVKDFAFGRLSIHRLQAGLYAGNDASRVALEKAGFRLDGTLHKQLWLDDKVGYVDHIWMCALRD